MKGNVAAVLIVIALATGAAVGYLGNRTAGGITTETLIRTYTVTTTLPQGESEVMRCVLTEYAVWETAYVRNGTAESYGNSTETIPVQTYQTTASVMQAVGYVTTSTSTYATFSGALAEGNYTICTYIPG